jgi:hypothetical protein
MRSLYALLAVFPLSLNHGLAQTISSSDIVPPNGTYTVTHGFVNASPTSLDSSGTNAFWSFSSSDLENAVPLSITVANASTSPYFGQAPNANAYALIGELDNGIHRYWRVTSSVFEDLLEVQVALEIENFIPACPRLFLNLPSSVGSVVQPTLEGCTPGVQNTQRKVLALGTLQTPFGTYTQVYLIRTSRCGDDPFGGGTLCTHTYEWFKQGDLLVPLMSLSYAEGLGGWVGGLFYLPPSTTGIGEQGDTSGFMIHPNPASDGITLQRADGNALGLVSIHSADGRSVRSELFGIHRTSMDVKDLKPGVYLVSCQRGEVPVVLRFVKE